MKSLLLIFLSISISLSAVLDPILKRLEADGRLSEKVLVLKKDGSISVESLKRKSLRQLKAQEDIVYIQAPRKLKPTQDEVVGYSTLALWGSSSGNIIVNTVQGQELKIIPFNANLSFSGSCTGTLDSLNCTSGSLILNATASDSYRILLISKNATLPINSVSGASGVYSVGTEAFLSQRKGRGVIVGVVDSGVNFCHPAFRKADGSSRIIYFYEPHSGLEMDRVQIETKIRNGDCNYDLEGHGTRVAGLIANLAQEAEFIIVRLREWMDYEVIMGMDYIKTKATQMGRPVVLNLSLGGHFDPHDGKGILDRAVEQFSGSGRIVVASAGNEGDSAIHASADLTSGPVTVSLVTNSSFGDLIDGWYRGNVRVEFCKGSSCLGADAGTVVSGDIGSCPVFIDNTTTSSPLNGDGEFIVDYYCSGTFSLKLIPSPSAGRVDLYLAHNFSNSFFTTNFSTDSLGGYMGTVGTPGTAFSAITAGAITSRTILGPSRINQLSFTDLGLIAFFSSRGPTRDGRIKPDISAGGLWVYTPMNDGVSYGPSAGTSFSAPIVSSIVAQLLEVQPGITPAGVKQALCSNAFLDGVLGTIPNNTYGCGKVSARLPAQTPGEGRGSGGGGGGCSFSKHSEWDFVIISMLAIIIIRRFLRHAKRSSLIRVVAFGPRTTKL